MTKYQGKVTFLIPPASGWSLPQGESPQLRIEVVHLYSLSSEKHPCLVPDIHPQACREVGLDGQMGWGFWENTLTSEVDVARDSVRI